TSLGAGGGTGGFNSGQQAVIGIKPLNGGGGGGGGGGGTINQDGIALYAATTVSANPFQSGNAFSVFADIANNGSTNFTGDFAAAIFDNNGVFIQFVQEFPNETAQAGFHYQVTFSTNQLQLIPGTYYIGLYYKNGSNNYSLINPGSFFNPVTITVTGPYSDIQMTNNTTTTPATIVKNAAITINTGMGNAGVSAFNGWLSADIFTLEGDYVTTVEEFQVTLDAQTPYNVTFESAGLNVDPGTYLLAFFSTTNQQNYSLAYAQNYPNPVEITIVEPGLSPDIYENNNTEASPYVFNPSFNGNSASVLTTGTNMHLGNDYDYFSVNLPGGTDYAITARVHDSYSAGNGQTYTNDAQFSYKVNGGSWSSTYDDVMGGAIVVNGGGTVTFFVADYFQGTTGTYLLDLQIQRGSGVGIKNITGSNISVFPNPTSGALFIDAGDVTGNYNLKLFNLLGEQMTESNGAFNGQLLKTDVSAFVPGVYTLQLKTENGISSSKFIVK
ncbi:MAG TPA: T9SS type A sorting domain-containing protein, partial [Chitinophagales bacterium]|nr:T9SS type A sorting domain-containing protein [Chitinophagales bacterium]